MSAHTRTSTTSVEPPLPIAFANAVAEIADAPWRPEMVIGSLPAPQKIAPHATAISADVVVADEELASGRLILLHDPAGNAGWEGQFRFVTFAHADVDAEMAADPLLAEVAWTWLIESLERQGGSYLAPSGTVTVVQSTAFGTMELEPGRAEVEIRASWTPVFDTPQTITPHLLAWAELLCTTAGLPPLPSGVVMMPTRRSSARHR
jgi:hypothetical protein